MFTVTPTRIQILALCPLLAALPGAAATSSLDISGTWTGVWSSIRSPSDGSVTGGNAITLQVTPSSGQSFTLSWKESGSGSAGSWQGSAQVYPSNRSITMPNGTTITTTSPILGSITVQTQNMPCDLHFWTLTNAHRIDGHFSCRFFNDPNESFTLTR